MEVSVIVVPERVVVIKAVLAGTVVVAIRVVPRRMSALDSAAFRCGKHLLGATFGQDDVLGLSLAGAIGLMHRYAPKTYLEPSW